MRFGKIKNYARRLIRGIPIPMFWDNNINREIDKHADRIAKAKTKYHYSRKNINSGEE